MPLYRTYKGNLIYFRLYDNVLECEPSTINRRVFDNNNNTPNVFAISNCPLVIRC